MLFSQTWPARRVSSSNNVRMIWDCGSRPRLSDQLTHQYSFAWVECINPCTLDSSGNTRQQLVTAGLEYPVETLSPPGANILKKKTCFDWEVLRVCTPRRKVVDIFTYLTSRRPSWGAVALYLFLM